MIVTWYSSEDIGHIIKILNFTRTLVKTWNRGVMSSYYFLHFIPYFGTRNKTNKGTHRCVNLLYYKQHSLLHVSASYCGLLQKVFFKGSITYIERSYVLCCYRRTNNTDSFEHTYGELQLKKLAVFCHFFSFFFDGTTAFSMGFSQSALFFISLSNL